ncbi:UNKNOWN [Stylonychia lemnae]|uniref:Pectin lyase fold/virulence factor n=1 Tax=Stylonychia lemnae TaxID=5949 RepID=A0A078AQM9_STYLE|nr:UNKNOWN [Stylonychia lemnae]|eukprot:CDW84499.1 UNKNOWN [Stylonychia lemnae]
MMISQSIIICDKNYEQINEFQALSGWIDQPKNKAQFYLQNSQSVTLMNNDFQKCGYSSQGGLFSLQKTTLTDYNSIYKNISGQYGGVLFAQDSIISITQSKFIGNLAKTGGVFYIVSNSNLSISYCQFQQNQAVQSAGVLYVSTQSIFNVKGSIFEQNKAEENSVIEVLNTFLQENVIIINCQFLDNVAAKNTISMIYSNVQIKDTLFNNNYAKYRSKNLLLEFVNITIQNTIFQNKPENKLALINDETSGGALYILGDSVIRISRSSFINNQANSKGGAIYTSGFESIFIGEGTKFINNSAVENGEDIYVTNSLNMLTLNNVFVQNLKSKNSIYIEQAILNAENLVMKDLNQNYESKMGAGIFCNYCKSFKIKSSQFINLKSIVGGAISIIEIDINKGKTQEQKEEKFYITDSLFQNCTAQIGGAIYAENAQSVKIVNSTFSENKALIVKNSLLQITNKGSGGAVYYTCNSQQLNCKMKFEGFNIFQDNLAEVKGGALFWDQLEPEFSRILKQND